MIPPAYDVVFVTRVIDRPPFFIEGPFSNEEFVFGIFKHPRLRWICKMFFPPRQAPLYGDKNSFVYYEEERAVFWRI